MSIKLLVASTNQRKLQELRELLADLDLSLISLSQVGDFQAVEEEGKTFEENASQKALGYAAQSGLLTLAEDSGLCCDALEGAPGIYSARFAGSQSSDVENNTKLLRLLKGVPDNCRAAYFKSAVALAEPGHLIAVVTGEVHGVVAHSARGNHGFGYDPIFFYPPYGKTFGEIPPEKKHAVSHRSQALRKAKEVLKEYLGT